MIATAYNEVYGIGYLAGTTTPVDKAYIFKVSFFSDNDIQPSSSNVQFLRYDNTRLYQAALYQVGGIPYVFFVG